MLIADSTARAFENIAARQREILNVFPPQNESELPGSLRCEPPAGIYFVTLDGRGGRAFVRPAALHFTGGQLSDGSGRAILGYTSPGSPLLPLRAHSVDAAVGWTGDAHIGSDGVVWYDRSSIDPVTGDRRAQRVTIGRIAVARFPAGTKLAALDGSVVSAPPGVTPHLGVPGNDSFAPLGSATVNAFDRDLDDGLQRLQEAYLSLDALRAAGAAEGSVQKTAMDLLK